MLVTIHEQIIHKALDGICSPHAQEIIIAANIRQDELRNQVGHDEFHFDNNAFDKSNAYIKQQSALAVSIMERGETEGAWQAYGRLSHSAQDFYSHTNYVELWLERRKKDGVPAAKEIDPLDPELINSPALRSGKLYYPLEALSFIPALKKFVIPLLPHDSHAWMNLDSAERGPLFEYAYQAAVKRTKYEFELIEKKLSPENLKLFQDLQ